MDYDKLDDVGKEWYKLWKQYAPNNQTFDEFKAMTNGNLDEMKQMVKNWDGLGKGAAYSTYDPKMTKAFKDFNAKEEELNQWWNDEWVKRYQKFLDNGGTGKFIQSDEYRQMVTEYRAKYNEAQKAIPTQWQIGQEFQLKNLANVVDERVKIMDDIVASNPEIQSKLTKQAWKNLSEEERLGVAQQILDEYAAKLGTPKAEVLIDRATKFGGYYTPGTNRISLNPKAQFNSPDYLTEILAHEYGHLVDDLDPNVGALGSQYSYYGNKIYRNQEKAGYRIALTEQSSYAIGNTTGRTAEKTLDQAAAAGLGGVGGATIEIGVMDQLTNK